VCTRAASARRALVDRAQTDNARERKQADVRDAVRAATDRRAAPSSPSVPHAPRVITFEVAHTEPALNSDRRGTSSSRSTRQKRLGRPPFPETSGASVPARRSPANSHDQPLA
jgi:hypothetical protein